MIAFTYMSLRATFMTFNKPFKKVYEDKSTFQPMKFRFLCKNSYLLQCWKCGSKFQDSSLFCKECNSIKKPNTNSSYFDLFEVKHRYEINEKELTTKYRKMQNVLHPDRFSTKTKEEQQISEEYSALVNRAYTTLLHPMRRGLYMLQQQGLQLPEDNTQSDPQFLALIMETNEELAEAESSEDIQKLDNKNKEVLGKLTRDLAASFNSGDIDGAKQVLIKMKYYASIDARIKELKQKLSIE